MHYAFSDGFPARSKSPLRVQGLTGPNPGSLLQYRYKPDGLPPGAPLLVILHGCGQSAAALDLGAGWSDLAQRFGFGLLAPEQTISNNMGTCFNWFQPGDTARGQGEAASIRQMILETAKDFASDPTRIFITGLSAGGGMTSAMLAAYPELFAAGAIMAGLPAGAASNMHEAMSAMHRAPVRSAKEWGDAVREASNHKGAYHKGPWPRISVWHGACDRTVGISNQDAIVAQWRDVLGLTAEPVETHLATARALRWGDGGSPAKLECLTVPGMGHGIAIKPGNKDDACGEPAPFILDVGISSSFHIAEFFGLLADAEKVKQKPEAKAKEPKLKVAAKVVAKVVLPRPMPPPPQAASLPHLMPIKLAPIKTVIVKALTAAGLIKKP